MKRKLSAFAQQVIADESKLHEIEIVGIKAQHEKLLVARNAEFAREADIAKKNIDRFERYWQEEITLRKKHEEECHELRQSEHKMLRRISQVMGELHQLRGAIVEYALTLGHTATSEDKARIVELQQKISGTDQRTACEATRPGSHGQGIADAMRPFSQV